MTEQNHNETYTTEMPRVMTEEEKRNFEGITLDEEGNEEVPQSVWKVWRWQDLSLSTKLLIAAGTVAAAVLLVVFGSVFLVVAAVVSLLAFIINFLSSGL